MKKLNAKFIASAVLAAIVASAMTISASAASYYTPPSYDPVPTNPTTPADDTDEEDKTDESTTETVITDKDVEAAIENSEAIEVESDENGNIVLQESAIGEIAAADEPVVFEVSDEGSDTDYTVVIDPALITEVDGDLDLALNIQILTSDDDVSDVDVPAGSIVIAPSMHGNFGLTLEVTLPASAVAGLDLNAVCLYYIADDGSVTPYPDALVVNDDGSVTFAISHASAYVISDVDLTESAVDAGLDLDDDDDDDVTIDEPSTTDQGKDNTSVVVNGNGTDTNPVTGTTLALGSLAVFAAAAVATSKKRK